MLQLQFETSRERPKSPTYVQKNRRGPLVLVWLLPLTKNCFTRNACKIKNDIKVSSIENNKINNDENNEININNKINNENEFGCNRTLIVGPSVCEKTHF